jgi:hypothetical protein
MAGTSILLCGGSQISPDFTKRIKRQEESDPSTGHPFYRSTFLHWTVDMDVNFKDLKNSIYLFGSIK